jgi:hypothetical protein
MELNIQEIEKEKDSNNKNNKNKRKQISYDDLLSNMGFKLNNGKLELYNKKIDQNPNVNNSYQNPNVNNSYQNLNVNNSYQNPNVNNSYQNLNTKQNNYSKSYTNNLNIQENIKETQPMTKRQYKRLIQLQYLQNMKERERINTIKSKKLLFSNPLTINNINQSISVPNKFFNFSR